MCIHLTAVNTRVTIARKSAILDLWVFIETNYVNHFVDMVKYKQNFVTKLSMTREHSVDAYLFVFYSDVIALSF